MLKLVACRWWDLQIERVIRQQWARPKFRAAHGEGRDYNDPTNYFGSPGFEELDAITGGNIGKGRPPNTPPCSMWWLGADALCLTTWSKRKTTAYGIFCEELPPDMSRTNDAGWGVVIVIEGEEEATDQGYCLQRTVSVLKKHCPMPTNGKLLIAPPRR
jgi:hypothetical protein